MAAKKTDQKATYSMKDSYMEMPPEDRAIALERQCDEVLHMDVRHDLTTNEIQANNIQVGELMSKIQQIETKIGKLTDVHITPLKEEIKGFKKVLNPIVKANAKGFEIIQNVKCYRITDPSAGQFGMTYFFNEDGVLVEERRAMSEELKDRSIFSSLKTV